VAGPRPKVVHYSRVPAEPAGDGASIRWLINEEEDSAPHFVLRLIEVAPGGNTPQHTHPYEHENFVVEGQGKVLLEDKWHEIGPGEVIFVPAGTLHQYVNCGKGTLRFLCAIPAKKYQS
jgi:quercetin dioxygenase-like cupin family protein